MAAIAPLSLAQSAPPAPVTSQARVVIVLDAAHGGSDAGAAFSNGQTEKSITLALSVKLRSLLAARGFKVVTTRESDVSVDPDHRAEIANQAKPAACLSLHASESGSGVHLFASSLPPVQSERFVAWKTAQAGWVTRSLALTGVLNSALQHAGAPVTLSRASLPALDAMSCPAVAVEIAPGVVGESSTPLDPSNPDYQSQIADALAAALLQWRTEAQQP